METLAQLSGAIIPIWFLFMAASVIFSLAALAFWIWMLVDCLQNEPSEGNEKVIWILVIVLTNWIGALIYYFVRRQERMRRHRHHGPPRHRHSHGHGPHRQGPPRQRAAAPRDLPNR